MAKMDRGPLKVHHRVFYTHRAHTCIHMCACIHTHTRTRAHTHTHTHTHTSAQLAANGGRRQEGAQGYARPTLY